MDGNRFICGQKCEEFRKLQCAYSCDGAKTSVDMNMLSRRLFRFYFIFFFGFFGIPACGRQTDSIIDIQSTTPCAFNELHQIVQFSCKRSVQLVNEKKKSAIIIITKPQRTGANVLCKIRENAFV